MYKVWPLIVIIASLVITPAHAGKLPKLPLSKQMLGKSFSNVNRLELPALDIDALRKSSLNKAKSAIPAPLKFAEEYSHQLDVAKSSGWQQTIYSGLNVAVWRYEITSPNAYSLNLGFSKFSMPKDGHLFIYSDDEASLIGPFSALNNNASGELWTPMISGKKIVIEVNVPADQLPQLELELRYINQGFLDIDPKSDNSSIFKSGSCNVDVACPVSLGWEDQIRSVARYTRSGQFLCTGVAINNTRRDGRPLFLTANHCGVDINTDASVVAYWNYQNSFCRAPNGSASGNAGNGSLLMFSTGSNSLASGSPDFSLIEFFQSFPADANVFLAGWNRSTSLPSRVVSIHHPRGEEKRISFENDPVIETRAGETDNRPGSGYLKVDDWDLGTTEPGSSGGPLFDPSKRIVGQLLGGFAACGNNEPDWYGFFARSWQGGEFPASTPSARLEDWLDTVGSNLMALDGMNAIAPDVYEQDNIPSEAKQIFSGIPQRRNIHRPGEDDWAKFTIDTTAAVELAIVGMPAGTSVDLSYNSSGVIFEFIEKSSGTNPRISIENLTAGDYFVRVDPSNQNGPINYTLLFNEVVGDAFEDDNSSVTASPIGLGEVQQHSLYEAFDEDWVQFVVAEKMEIVISTSGNFGNTFLRLFDMDMNELASNDNIGNSQFSRISQNLEPGTYFVQVTEATNKVLGRYNLEVRTGDEFLLELIPAIMGAVKNKN